jgi:hypothetical protein
MNVAISGSRSFRDRHLVELVMDRLYDRGDFILYGDAPSGVDDFVNNYQRDYGEPSRARLYHAHWKTLGKGAGHERNGRMIADADMLIAIFSPGRPTPGTSNAFNQARSKHIPIFVFHGYWAFIDPAVAL